MTRRYATSRQSMLRFIIAAKHSYGEYWSLDIIGWRNRKSRSVAVIVNTGLVIREDGEYVTTPAFIARLRYNGAIGIHYLRLYTAYATTITRYDDYYSIRSFATNMHTHGHVTNGIPLVYHVINMPYMLLFGHHWLTSILRRRLSVGGFVGHVTVRHRQSY